MIRARGPAERRPILGVEDDAKSGDDRKSASRHWCSGSAASMAVLAMVALACVGYGGYRMGAQSQRLPSVAPPVAVAVVQQPVTTAPRQASEPEPAAIADVWRDDEQVAAGEGEGDEPVAAAPLVVTEAQEAPPAPSPSTSPAARRPAGGLRKPAAAREVAQGAAAGRGAPPAKAAAVSKEGDETLLPLRVPVSALPAPPGDHLADKPFLPQATTLGFMEAWRAGAMCWHDMVPQSVLQPYDAERLAGMTRHKELVSNELGVITHLQGFDASGTGPMQPAVLDALLSAAAALRAAGLPEPTIALAGPRDVSPWRAPELESGPMRKYASCSAIRDKCMIHSTLRECADDELCGWCTASKLCLSRFVAVMPEKQRGSDVPTCKGSKLVVAASSIKPPEGTYRKLERMGAVGGSLTASEAASQCTVVVTRRRSVRMSMGGNSAMAYHFITEEVPTLFTQLHDAGGVDHLSAHIWVDNDSVLEFVDFAVPFSDSCTRFTSEYAAIQDNGHTICYKDQSLPRRDDFALAYWSTDSRSGVPGVAPPDTLESEDVAVQAGMRLGLQGVAAGLAAELTRLQATGGSIAHLIRGLPGAADGTMTPAQAEERLLIYGRQSFHTFLVSILGLWTVVPDKPLVTIMSRRNKRLLLNEAELVRVCLELGVDVQIASLETMTVYEQIRLFRRTNVLVGVHGSGLINTPFMVPGTAVLQILPWHLQSGATFFQGPAEGVGVKYFELAVEKRESSVFHYHFLGGDFGSDGALESALQRGSGCCGEGVYFSFWINQDLRVDPEAFRRVLRDALTVPSLNAALYSASEAESRL